MIVSLVAAVASSGVIGRDNALPWHLPEDLARFKRLTTGHTIVMGRKTFESIGRPLPERRTIVVTRKPDFGGDGIEVAGSVEQALSLAQSEDEVFVVGGAAIYRAALPQADRIYLTQVHAAIPGDVDFPAWDPSEWRLVWEERHLVDSQHAYPFTFQRFDRVRPSRHN